MSYSVLIGALSLAQAALAPIAPAASTTTATSVQPTLTLPALTPLRLRVDGEVSSKTHVTGDKLVIFLADPLRLTDTLVLPAGTRGVAEVVHAAKAGMGGKAGELLIAARYLELGPDLRIPLRSFRLAPARGKSQEGLAMGLGIAGGLAGSVAGLIITGGSARIPPGSEAFAKTASAVELPLALLHPAAAAPAAPSPLTTTTDNQGETSR